MARKLELDVEAKGAAKVDAELKSVARNIDNVGDQAAQTTRRLSAWGRELTATERKLAASVPVIHGAAKAIDDIGDQAAQSERKLHSLGRAMESTALKSKLLGGGRSGRAGQASLPFDLSSTLMSKGPLIGVGGPAIASALPGIGAIVAAATIAGAGLAGIAAGVIAQAHDPKVVQAWSEVGKRIKADFLADTSAFAPELAKSAQIFGSAWAQEQPRLKAIFDDLSKSVVPLTEGVAGGARGILHGIEDLIAHSGPVLTELGHDISLIGTGIGEGLSAIADSAPGATKALHDLSVELADATRGAGQFVAVLSDTYDFLSKYDPYVLLVTHGYQYLHLLGSIAAGEAKGNAGRSLGSTAGATASALQDAATNANRAAGFYSLLQDAERGAAAGARDLSKALQDQVGVTLGLDDANLRVDSALLNLRETFKKNKHSLDEHTQAGIEDRQAILDTVGAFEQQREAAIAAAGGENASKEAVDAANAKFKNQVDALGVLLKSLGLTDGQIRSVLQAYKDLANQKDIVKHVRIIEDVGAGGFGGGSGSGHPLHTRGPIEGFAEGGMIPGPPGKPRLILAHGGEYVIPRGGTQVGSAGRGGIALEIHSGGSGLDDLLLEILRKAVRVRGGNVQLAIAGRAV